MRTITRRGFACGIALLPSFRSQQPTLKPAVNGRQPQQFNAKTLMRKASRLPVDWGEQRALLGF